MGTLRPTLLVNVRASYNRFVQCTADRDNFGFDITRLGFPQSLAAQLPNPQYFGRYTYGGYVTQGFDTRLNITNNYAIHPNLTWIRSSHSIRFSLDYRWVQYATKDVGVLFGLNANTVFGHVQFDERGWETGRHLRCQYPRPSSTLPVARLEPG